MSCLPHAGYTATNRRKHRGSKEKAATHRGSSSLLSTASRTCMKPSRMADCRPATLCGACGRNTVAALEDWPTSLNMSKYWVRRSRSITSLGDVPIDGVGEARVKGGVRRENKCTRLCALDECRWIRARCATAAVGFYSRERRPQSSLGRSGMNAVAAAIQQTRGKFKF